MCEDLTMNFERLVNSSVSFMVHQKFLDCDAIRIKMAFIYMKVCCSAATRILLKEFKKVPEKGVHLHRLKNYKRQPLLVS